MSEVGLVQRTIWVLRAVAAHPEGIGLSDVARESGIPKATCYRVLRALELERWLALDQDTRRYRVSLGLLSVVGGLLDQTDSYVHMRAALKELADEVRETAGFDVLIPPKVMVVAQASGPFMIGQTLKPVPRTQPVWRTSSGKVLLASLDPETVREQFGEDFRSTQHAPTASLDDFLASLDDVRRRGYGFAYDELEAGAASVAAPVWVRGRVSYAVWIGGPTYRITRDRIDELAGTVRRVADHLGQLLSVAGPQPALGSAVV